MSSTPLLRSFLTGCLVLSLPVPSLRAGMPLQEALTRALENEPGLKVNRLGVPLAEANRGRIQATWDSRLTGRAEITDETAVASTGLDGASVRETNARRTSMSLSKPLHNGGNVSLSANDNRSSSNSAFTLLNPAYRTGIQVSLERPLSQGAGRDANLRSLRQADLDLERAQLELRGKVLDLLARTERAYWNLASSQERRDVAQLSLDQAVQLLGWNKSRVEAGALARIAVIEAEAAVSQRESALLNAQLALENAQVDMIQLIDPPVRPESTLPDLESLPGEPLAVIPTHEEVLTLGLEKHPQYRQALHDLEGSKIEVAFAKDQLLPRIDLVATMEVNGLGSNRENSLEQASRADFPKYFVGFSWELPLGRRAARSELQRRRLLQEQAIRQVKNLEIQLESQIQAALRRYSLNLRSQAVATKSLEASRIKLEAERSRYEEGMITADDLLRFQRELAEAHATEVSARIQTSVSAMEIWVAAGALPEKRGVGLTDLDL